MEGWIKLHRQLLLSPVFAHQNALKIWIWCLCKASHTNKSISIPTGRGETIVTIERGQFIFGRFKAEEELCINGSTIYKWLHKFKDEMEMIEIESNSHYSIITILNFSDFQEVETNNVTSKEQPKDKQVTTKGQASNTYKNDKNVKNDKNNKETEILNFGEPDKSKPMILVKSKYANTPSYRIYGTDGYSDFIASHGSHIPQHEVPYVSKFMREKDGVVFVGDVDYVINSFKNYIKLQYA